ncbi:nucleotidyltransferase domain-containing protein [Oceanobacillus bengalensis]|uniref:Nucleotidyltransferase domain-containing protein n=1 Tax=Oceanobacillus bengalensis TaxID=1435466 RepID=A0A494YUE8_9BACI|nr:nucleotidyltransferase domain-containing protein [Oceanobacillus bengalensis]RKQ13638.1 nucleotidyltransferase domain-containing protein [Oceanobacillus bengalensis]
MIEQRLIEQLFKIGQRIDTIEKIVLFGSRAVGDHTEKSDIDLAFVAPNMTKREWTEFTFTLEEELDTLLFLDMIKYEDAQEELKEEIRKDGKILYSAESTFDKKTS